MKEISFVVQGPIITRSDTANGVYSTAAVLQSIRRFYPNAEVILSTWKGSELDGLSYDHVILNEDPGPFLLADGVAVNCNRLIQSTKAGVLKATNPYIVKTRTDILITADKITKQLDQIRAIYSTYAVFENFILSSTYYVRDPIKYNWVFHPSDIFLVGTKNDILSYFNIPLATKPEFINDAGILTQVAEQYLFTQRILKAQNKDFRLPWLHYTKTDFFINSERYLFNNFTFFSIEELGIEFPKRLYFALVPKANYTLNKARQLSIAYQNESAHKNIILFRAARYFFKYVLMHYPRVAYLKTFNQLLPKNKSKKNGNN